MSELNFTNEENEVIKNLIINSVTNKESSEDINTKINTHHSKTIMEINKNSNIHMITLNKTEKGIEDLLSELIVDHKEESNLKKIESLEQKLINNLDENSYSELLKLKNQLNRD